MSGGGNNVVINIQVAAGPATQAVNDLNASIQNLTTSVNTLTAAQQTNNAATTQADNNLETLGRRINLLSSSFGDQTRAMVILENRIVAIVSQLQEMEPAAALGFGALTIAIAAAGAAFAVYNERVEAARKSMEAFYKINKEAAETDPYHPAHGKTDAENAEMRVRAAGADTEAAKRAAAFRIGLAGVDTMFGGKVDPDSWAGAARAYGIRAIGGIKGIIGNGSEYERITERGEYLLQQESEKRQIKFEEEKAAKEELKNAKFRAEQTAAVEKLKEEEKKAMEKVVAEELAHRKKVAAAEKKAAEEHEREVEQTGKRLMAAQDKRDAMAERHAEAEEVDKINKQKKFKAMDIENDAEALYKKMAGQAGGKGKTQEEIHDEIKAVHEKYYKMNLDKQDIIIQELTDLHVAAVMG